MSVRNLEFLFAPRSVAVFGASDRPHSVGATVWRNLTQGYKGALYPVNLRLRQLGEHPVFGSVAQLPQAPDLAIICTRRPPCPA
jgi:acetyltransferase